ncbi:hypothetical protein ThrDRAFT_01705 [Frankia casuarinae]|jgi:hypothetical protein|uniref:Uncharacterized protein n=1 Tax=Frankia casuarinae (strain DSM 45818 / CECT 9043 / HFP020203 / CcI3) TaxID=106370 RepID=Q2JEL0_FRACC|nr:MULTISPECIES: hypothetical protein [Frankia]ABD10282.1 conserved hypothetical protein [Frankia casuarinae]ETA01966.1 hypothetical protein CcI6DRAFT_02652 [Frankia sp. CcI6]EYT92587.1 hypothetical protein ThrDRAFT_01705 [Frankia casuarinae]KFB05430.1 hypothetical protein ALLO2DRAFT_01669 [Frankia sp. Allo2]OAA24657.1 hypothetical protein AAY23_104573 [Frankia casuarinae]
MEHVIEPLRGLDWNDIDAVEHATRKALTQFADDPDLIRVALLELPNRPELLALCEHYDILDKIVLYQDDAGIRVRLHVFLPGYFDRPHNHRWSYASRIVRGEYRHYLFGDLDVDAEPEPGSLTALQVRQEQIGDTYALHHSMVHAVVAEPYTVSLVIRGPAVKERFLVMDRGTGERWWQYGAEQETAGDAARKRMTRERLDELTGLLREWDLF